MRPTLGLFLRWRYLQSEHPKNLNFKSGWSDRYVPKQLKGQARAAEKLIRNFLGTTANDGGGMRKVVTGPARRAAGGPSPNGQDSVGLCLDRTPSHSRRAADCEAKGHCHFNSVHRAAAAQTERVMSKKVEG